MGEASSTTHIWLPDGGSTYGSMGPAFTLLRFDRRVDVEGLVVAAECRGVPLSVVDLEPDRSVYPDRLVLSRPDQHVAWRGTALPADPLRLIDQVRGALI